MMFGAGLGGVARAGASSFAAATGFGLAPAEESPLPQPATATATSPADRATARARTAPNVHRTDEGALKAHHGMGARSRKKPPVGPSSGRVAAHVIVSAPSSTERGAPAPPMSVRTQPGQTEF